MGVVKLARIVTFFADLGQKVSAARRFRATPRPPRALHAPQLLRTGAHREKAGGDRPRRARWRAQRAPRAPRRRAHDARVRRCASVRSGGAGRGIRHEATRAGGERHRGVKASGQRGIEANAWEEVSPRRLEGTKGINSPQRALRTRREASEWGLRHQRSEGSRDRGIEAVGVLAHLAGTVTSPAHLLSLSTALGASPRREVILHGPWGTHTLAHDGQAHHSSPARNIGPA